MQPKTIWLILLAVAAGCAPARTVTLHRQSMHVDSIGIVKESFSGSQTQIEFWPKGTEYFTVGTTDSFDAIQIYDTLRWIATLRFYSGYYKIITEEPSGGLLFMSDDSAFRKAPKIKFPDDGVIQLPDLQLPDLEWQFPKSMHISHAEREEFSKKFGLPYPIPEDRPTTQPP